MSEGERAGPVPMDPEDEEHKDVYAHFGLAVYWVQCFETSLTNVLILDARLNGTATTPEAIEALEKSLQNTKTLGGLIKHSRTQALLPEEAKALVNQALVKRNFLIHHFFRERAFGFMTATGRKKLLTELRETQAIVCLADQKATALYMDLAKIVGITPDVLQAEFEQMKKEARESEL